MAPRNRRHMRVGDEHVPQDDMDAMRQEMRELREENRLLRERMERGRQTDPPSPHVLAPRRVIRRMLDDEGVSIYDFRKLRPPEFNGEEGEEPQEFLERMDKLVRRLPCSDAKVIELVGVQLNSYAGDWYRENVEDRLYGENPPTWEVFKRELIDEFLAEGEKENRRVQFEKLRQKDMTVTEYAKEFNRLSKYASKIIPTEAIRINRFKRGLILPLYNALCATEFTSLSKLIDKAKQLEARYEEERAYEDQELKKKSKSQNSQRKKGESSSQVRTYGNVASIMSQSRPREKSKTQGRIENTTVNTSSRVMSTSSLVQHHYEYPTCSACKKKHEGRCRFATRACLRCGKPGHFIKDCPRGREP